jgi:adenylate cyclase
LIVRVAPNSNRAENYRLAGHIQGEVLRLEIGDQNGVDVGVWTTVLDQDLSNVADKISRSILVKLGRADEVVERFQNTIQPDVFRSYLAATALLRNSHTADASQRAEDIYLNVLAAEPHYAPAHAGLCSTYLIRYSQSMKEGLFLSAEQHCHRALTLDERDPTVYMALGMLYRETGQPTKAINSYHKALSIAPYSTDAMRGLAETLDRSGATAEANQWYLDAIQVEPSHWENYQALGKHQFGNGQFDLAIESFQTALSLAPDEIGVSNNIGAAHFMAENFQQAVTYWQQVAEREPSPQIYANLAISYFYQRQFNQALAMYESAHRAAPDDFRWVGHIGEVLNVTKSAAAQPYFQQAIELATGQLNIDPDNGLTLSDVATYYAGLGKGNDVHSLLDRALEDNAEDIDVVYNAAVAYSRLGEAELALIMVEKLRSLGYAESLLALDANFDGLYSTK